MLIVSHDTPNPKLSDFIDTYIDKSYDTCTCSEVSDKLIEFEYQLVIFDISQNSEEVLNAMNSSLSFWENTPCLVYCTSSQKHDVLRAICIGASDFIVQPINIDLAVRTIRKYM